jgi:hypothetical protein
MSKLGRAANYFINTPVAGWNGTGWDDNITMVSLQTYDRFISDREFGSKRRMLLVRPGEIAFDTYSVIKFSDDSVYMVGTDASDIAVDQYSRVMVAYKAQGMAEILGFTKTLSASGMAGSAVRTVIGHAWCDAERVTSSNSKEFDHVSFTQSTLTLPRDATVGTENEVHIGEKYYTISESFLEFGLRTCRAMAKRSA